MPEYVNRDGFETAIADYLSGEYERILGDFSDLIATLDANMPLTAIGDMQLLAQENIHWIEDRLESVYVDAANMYTDNIAYGVDEAALNRAAQAWSADRARMLVGQLNTTTQERVNTLIANFNQGGMTNAQLIERLEAFMSRSRAEITAITEVTRAATEGQEYIANQLRQAGIDMSTLWQTVTDERVCPICQPRHNQPQGSNWFDLPPAHPRCRCFVTYEVA